VATATMGIPAGILYVVPYTCARRIPNVVDLLRLPVYRVAFSTVSIMCTAKHHMRATETELNIFHALQRPSCLSACPYRATPSGRVTKTTKTADTAVRPVLQVKAMTHTSSEAVRQAAGTPHLASSRAEGNQRAKPTDAARMTIDPLVQPGVKLMMSRIGKISLGCLHAKAVCTSLD
jgi:hypothetical protein